MNFFLEYWAPIIATLGFLLSLWNLFQALRLKHSKPSINLNWICKVGPQYNICLVITNTSTKPITITLIDFIDESYMSTPYEYPVKLQMDNETGKKVFSDSLPINIQPFSSRKVIIAINSKLTINELVDPKFRGIKCIYDLNKSVTVKIIDKQIFIDARSFSNRIEKLASE